MFFYVACPATYIEFSSALRGLAHGKPHMISTSLTMVWFSRRVPFCFYVERNSERVMEETCPRFAKSHGKPLPRLYARDGGVECSDITPPYRRAANFRGWSRRFSHDLW